LIITADDFGYDVERNRGIVECFLLGAVTRASLLVNGVACNDACTLANKYNIPLGLLLLFLSFINEFEYHLPY